METDWFSLAANKENRIANLKKLTGKTAEVSIMGFLAKSGKVDVKFTIYDDIGDATNAVSKIGINATGGQLATTKIRGKLKYMP